ncbi:MAG TPA: PLP-dependent aminotransferase family protein [Euzebyales bacterium]|nr:PLP-dependent aminotransferase family protein [Euzebyales bacterium]
MNADILVPILGDWNNNGRPLNESLADSLAAAVQRGELEPGVVLPAERSLARSLNVSRGTVVAAYRRLRDHGLASTRHGSGTTIDGDAQGGRGQQVPFVNLLRRYDGDVLSFRSADWNGDALPTEVFEAAAPSMASLSATAGYFPTGLPELREAIAAHLGSTGLETSPDQVLVTSGAQQAIALLIDLLVTPGVPVAVEQLSYPGALDALRTAGAVLHAVPMTPTGVDVPGLERVVARQRPVLTYLVPGVHNPTGLVLPRLARRRIAEMMATADTVLVEDLSLAETQLEGDIVPPISSYADRDAAQRIIAVGSMSKWGWSGLRIGWIRAPVQLIGRLIRHKMLADLGSSVPSQILAVRVLGRAAELRRRRVAGIRERLDVLTTELARQLPAWTWTPAAGGLCLWVRIGGDSSTRFAPIALRHGIAIAPGTVSAADGAAVDHIRLPLGHPPDVLREAVRRLAAAWRNDNGDHHGCGRDDVIV